MYEPHFALMHSTWTCWPYLVNSFYYLHHSSQFLIFCYPISKWKSFHLLYGTPFHLKTFDLSTPLSKGFAQSIGAAGVILSPTIYLVATQAKKNLNVAFNRFSRRRRSYQTQATKSLHSIDWPDRSTHWHVTHVLLCAAWHRARSPASSPCADIVAY